MHVHARAVYRQGGRAQLRTFFLTFGETGCASSKCICPLGKVLCPLHWGGGHIIFAFSGVHCRSRLVSSHFKEKYPMFTKFGMGVYWVNSLHAIAFGEDSSIAN